METHDDTALALEAIAPLPEILAEPGIDVPRGLALLAEQSLRRRLWSFAFRAAGLVERADELARGAAALAEAESTFLVRRTYGHPWAAQA